jgi:hypothetical protein
MLRENTRHRPLSKRQSPPDVETQCGIPHANQFYIDPIGQTFSAAPYVDGQIATETQLSNLSPVERIESVAKSRKNRTQFIAQNIKGPPVDWQQGQYIRANPGF